MKHSEKTSNLTKMFLPYLLTFRMDVAIPILKKHEMIPEARVNPPLINVPMYLVLYHA